MGLTKVTDHLQSILLCITFVFLRFVIKESRGRLSCTFKLNHVLLLKNENGFKNKSLVLSRQSLGELEFIVDETLLTIG